MKQTEIWDHNGYNMLERHTFIIFTNFGKFTKIDVFSEKVLISETVRDKAQRTKIWDQKEY